MVGSRQGVGSDPGQLVIDASVTVVGGGAIGGITVAKLTGHVSRVVVLDSDERHVQLLREPGPDVPGSRRRAHRRAGRGQLGHRARGRVRLRMIAVGSPFHRAALEPLGAVCKVDAFVSLGNGLLRERMAQLVGVDHLLSCSVQWGRTNVGPGRLVCDTIALMVVGELDGSERERTRLLARCLEPVGEVRLTRNLRGQTWFKLLVNSAFSGLSAVSGLRYGAVWTIGPDGSPPMRSGPKAWRSPKPNRPCSRPSAASIRASSSAARTPLWHG